MNRFCQVLFLGVFSVFLLASCSQTPPGPPRLPDGRVVYTYDEFVKRPDYRETSDIWYNDARIDRATKNNSKIVISLNSQRGQLYVDGVMALDFPACTGKAGHRTPKGTYRIIEKKKMHHSGSYGSVYNASGGMSVADATPGTRVPKGGKYVPAAMPLWMRIHGGIGMHVGAVYRDAASHGCIRIPPEGCSILFDKCPVGTVVKVQD